MKFDSGTLHDWKARGISDISCFLVARGCAGEKVEVVEGITKETSNNSLSQESITFHTRSSETDFFQNVRITGVKGKWIVSGEDVNIHCGCGSSFSRKTGNPLADKAQRIREKIRQKKEQVHK